MEPGHPGGIAMIERYVLGLEEIDKTQVALVGGKGAQLGELSRIEGILSWASLSPLHFQARVDR